MNAGGPQSSIHTQHEEASQESKEREAEGEEERTRMRNQCQSKRNAEAPPHSRHGTPFLPPPPPRAPPAHPFEPCVDTTL